MTDIHDGADRIAKERQTTQEYANKQQDKSAFATLSLTA
jgi:hypothetical protein